MELDHREGPTVQFTGDLWTPEQAMLLDDWWDSGLGALRHRETVIAKGRNQGVGEITQKFMAWFAAQAPDALNIAVLAHTEPARDRHIERFQYNINSLPTAIRPPQISKTNEKFVFSKGKKNTQVVGMTQGGKTGKGQGFTFQMTHMTECGMYKSEEDAQATVGSLTATMHRSSSYYFLVKESTSESPDSWWQREVTRAQNPKSGVNFRFFPWAINPSHREPFPNDHARREFMDSLSTDEQQAIRLYDNYLVSLAKTHPHNVQWIADNYPFLLALSPEALHWRRRKLENSYGNTFYLFAHDYPMTVDEAFLSGGMGWFDPTYLSEVRCLPGVKTRDGAEVWRHPEHDCRYAVGVDVGEGVGGDYSVICVVDHKLRQCFVWADNRTAPESVGELAVRVAATYHNAKLLIESNKRGAEAIKAARNLGYQNFYLEKSATGSMRDWVTRGNQFGSNKEMLYGHARTQMNAKRVEIADPMTLSELRSIGLDSRGSIGGRDKKHDDRAMAWVLAVWCARRIQNWQLDVDAEIDRALHIRPVSAPKRVLPFTRFNQ